MADGTKIQWTDASWNPIRARNKKTGEVGHYCELTSPGCAHCYASRFQARVGLPKFPGEGKLKPLPLVNGRGAVPVPDDLEVFLDEKVLAQPLHWKKPRRIFVCSMTDLFGDWVPDEWLDRVVAVMALTPQHTHQVLTKRAGRMLAYISAWTRPADVWRAASNYGYNSARAAESQAWPLPNVWLGVSVENQPAADERIPLLLQAPAAVRFLSCEPLLGPVDLRPKAPDAYATLGRFYDTGTFDPSGMSPAADRVLNCFPRIDWCVIGGESGPGARPMNVAWARSLMRQCKEAGLAAFVKQLGAAPFVSAPPDGYMAQDQRRLLPLRLRDKKGGDPAEWSEDLRVREFPR